MSAATTILISGLQTGTSLMRTETDNIVNSESNGFKQQLQFALNNTYAQRTIGGGATYDGNGVRAGEQTLTLFTPGGIKAVNDNLSVAIDGDDLFVLTDPATDEIFYTRGGGFRFNQYGVLIHTASGYQVGTTPIQLTDPLLSNKARIRPNGEVVEIDDNGEVTATIGRLELANFPDKSSLKRLAKGLYSGGGAGEVVYGVAGEDGFVSKILSNSIEGANVNTVETMIKIQEIAQYMTGIAQSMETINQAYKKITENVA